MLKKYLKKISLITAVLLLFQMASIGLGVGVQGALAMSSATTIDTPAITGVTAPVAGITPVSTATATAEYTAAVTWSPTATKFAEGTVYTATIDLTAKANYTLTGVPANFFTVADASFVENPANSGVVTAMFSATADITAPAGELLTLMTVNHPTPGIQISAPVSDIYTVPEPLTQKDVFTGLSLVVTDNVAMDTDPVNVYIDGSSNGTMVYSGSGNLWNYLPGSSVTFTPGPHSITATFSDAAIPVNTKLLTANFTTVATLASPIINPVTTPTSTNTQKITGTKVANTSIWLDGAEVVTNNVANTWEHTVNLVEGINNFSFVAKSLTVGDESLPVNVAITLDTKAPAMVTSLTAIINGAGYPMLSWVNPPVGTYSGLKVMRDDTFLTTLATGTTTFTDINAEKGTIYRYNIVAYNQAGETWSLPVMVSVPAPVVPSNQIASAAIGDSSYIVQEPVVSEQVKANEKIDLTNKEETKDENGLPAWGLILLLALAIIGGYLFYNQRQTYPSVQKITPTPLKSKSARPIKTPRKK